MKTSNRKSFIQNNSGIIVADFLFSFVMIMGIGMFIFGITFSLATIEVSQYIVWSTARNYAAANVNQTAARDNAIEKFNNLTAQFPLLTGAGSTDTNPWFLLSSTSLIVSDKLEEEDSLLSTDLPGSDKDNDFRQPWTGASAKLRLSLFSNMQIPFLGKVATDKSLFEFPIRAFIIRHPSTQECQTFFFGGRNNAIKALEGGNLSPDGLTFPAIGPSNNTTAAALGEDNGC